MTFFRMIFDQAVNHGNFSFFILVQGILVLIVGIITLIIMIRNGRPR